MSQLPSSTMADLPELKLIDSSSWRITAWLGHGFPVQMRFWTQRSVSTLAGSLNWNLVGSTLWSKKASPLAQDSVCMPHQTPRTPRLMPHWVVRSPSRLVRALGGLQDLVPGPRVIRNGEAGGVEEGPVVVEGDSLQVLGQA